VVVEGTANETHSNNTAGKKYQVGNKNARILQNGEPVKCDEDKNCYSNTRATNKPNYLLSSCSPYVR
jgi:hypothetical protein